MPIRPAGPSSGCNRRMEQTEHGWLSPMAVRMCRGSLRPLSGMGLKGSRTNGPAPPPSRRPVDPAVSQRGVGFATGVPAGGRFRLHGLLETSMVQTSRVYPPSAGPFRSIGVCTGPPARAVPRRTGGRVRATPLAVSPALSAPPLVLGIRYLVKIEGRWVYSICIVEGYSRTILAGMASEHGAFPRSCNCSLLPCRPMDARRASFPTMARCSALMITWPFSRRWRLNPSTSSCPSPGRTSLKRSLTCMTPGRLQVRTGWHGGGDPAITRGVR